jgi:hypothetical protein
VTCTFIIRNRNLTTFRRISIISLRVSINISFSTWQIIPWYLRFIITFGFKDLGIKSLDAKIMIFYLWYKNTWPCNDLIKVNIGTINIYRVSVKGDNTSSDINQFVQMYLEHGILSTRGQNFHDSLKKLWSIETAK